LVAIVAVGYGDGYPRHAPTGTPVRLLGQYAFLIGRVSMDMIAVDVTDIAEVRVGTKVVLWGQGLSVSVIAEHANTISYELLCGITRRVPCYLTEPPEV
jgi:alanine racemase